MNNPAHRSKIRPGRPYSPIPISILILLVWWVVAHNSGSGWVQLLGDSVFGMFIIGLFVPAIALARVRIAIVRAPEDVTAGSPVVLIVQTSGRVRVTPVTPPGPEAFVGPTGSGVEGNVTLQPERRGVHHEVVLHVATAAPFGLQWWTRRMAFPLGVGLHVAPRLGRPIPLLHAVYDHPGALGRPSPADPGDARGVRDYRRGDRRWRVHWGSSAHAGRLMVREMEEPARQPITLKLSLPTEPDGAERLAEDALGTIVAALDRGLAIVLATDELTGNVVEPVLGRREAGRRLARATPGTGSPGVELLG